MENITDMGRVPIKWRVLVCRNSYSDKYWAWRLDKEVEGDIYGSLMRGDVYAEVRYGRIGGLGKSQGCSAARYAMSHVLAKIKEKIRKGYREATEEEMFEHFNQGTQLAWEV